MSGIRIRPATVADAAACAAIYAPSVEGSVSFEEVPPDPAEMARRIGAALEGHAWLVAERDGQVIGYSYGTRHRERAAYRWATDVATYVAPSVQGEGLGRQLLEALLAELAGRGYRVACAAISLPNEASVGLHRSAGFEQSGLEHAIGWKAGAWRDVALYQRRLDRLDVA